MSEVKRLLFAALLCAVGFGVVSVPTALADEPKVKKPAAEPAKPIIIQIDASKLPPEVLKDLIKLSQQGAPSKPVVKPEPTKPAVKPVKSISLSDAIAIAEKLTKGTVVKAEREDEEGTVMFELEVLDGKGGKSKVILDAGGNVVKTGDDKEESKGKKKKQDDDDGK